MRTLLLMLLPILASGQIYVDSYRFGAPQELLLDEYPGAKLAYSLRLLDADYTGDCITVRRSSDNALDTFGFVNNYLDTTALKTFCGTSATDSCFISIWWNQADSSGVYGVKYATNGGNLAQPQIMTGGKINYKNGTPSIVFDGSNDSLVAINTADYIKEMHDGTNASFLFVAQINAANVLKMYIGTTNAVATNEVGFSVYQNASSNIVHLVNRNQAGRIIDNATSFTSTNTFLYYSNVDANNATAADRSEVYLNGGSAVKNNTSTNNPLTTNSAYRFRIGWNNNYGTIAGSFKEIVIYPNDQSSNRSGIQSNINTFYSIY
jgi:hypothetical protein